MRTFRFLFVAVLIIGFAGYSVMAATTDDATLEVDIDDIFFVEVGTAADWDDDVTAADLYAGYIESASLTEAMDIAGNATYEVNAQMSGATWDEDVDLMIKVGEGAYTTLNHTSVAIIDGLSDEAAGSQADLAVQWKLDGLTWANTATGDDFTNTVTFTCKAKSI